MGKVTKYFFVLWLIIFVILNGGLFFTNNINNNQYALENNSYCSVDIKSGVSCKNFIARFFVSHGYYIVISISVIVGAFVSANFGVDTLFYLVLSMVLVTALISPLVIGGLFFYRDIELFLLNKKRKMTNTKNGALDDL